ncbi:MAG: ATP-binding protein [Bacteroidales bacterium]|nr:ATP-binding protein [Bacteroidales bacterium]
MEECIDIEVNNLLFRRLDSKFKKAVFEYNLLEDGDRIMIGLSGGKDSLALLELLGRRARIYYPKFQLFAIHIVMKNIPYYTDTEYLKSLCDLYNIPLVVKETSFDPTTDKRKSPCFLCSWNRRKAIFEAAKEHNCTKIALGHHQDDILHTLLMNMTFQGAFSTMPPLLEMKKFEMAIIRPLCLISEKELLELAQKRNYRKQIKECPYESDSHRAGIKRVMQELEKMNPGARHSLWGSMTNIQEEYLP